MLPSPRIRARWVKVNAFPERNRFGRHGAIVDRCYTIDGAPHSIKVAYVRYHPFLAELDAMPHCPRAVKAIYRGSVRLGHMMAKDAWGVMADMDRAHAAWAKYQSAPAR